MGLGLEGAYGVEGAWDSLRNIIAERKKDELLKYKQEEDRRQFDLQQQQLEESRKFREMQFQGLQQDRADRNLDRDAARESLIEQRKVAEKKQMEDTIRARFNLLPPGQAVGAKDVAAAQTAGIEGLLTPNKIDPANTSAPQTWTYSGSAAAQQHVADAEARKAAAAESQDFRREMAATAASNRANQPLSPYQSLTATRQVANDWNKQIKSQRTMEQQLGQMELALKASEAGKRIGSDEAIAVTFEKILDPNSVVREGEYARLAGGQGLLDNIQGIFQRARAGGTGVTTEQLRNVVELSRQFVQNARAYNAKERTRVERLVTNHGLDPTEIFRDEEPAAPPPPTPSPTGKVDIAGARKQYQY